MLKGLEVNEVSISNLEYSGRLDSEYYKQKYVALEKKINLKKSIKLDEVSDFLIGPFGSAFTVDNYTLDKSFRYFRGKDVKPLRLMNNDNVYMPQKDYERLSKYALKENDILISVVGTVGNAALVTNKDLPGIFSCKSTVLRTAGINVKYLLVFLNSKYGKELLLRKERGAVQKGLNLDDLKTLNVFIPSDAFQEKIESLYLLSTELHEKSEKTYKKSENVLIETLGLENLDSKNKSVNVKTFKESFLTYGRLDSEYYQPYYDDIEMKIKENGYVLIDDICSEINYGTVPTSTYSEDSTGIPYIKGMNLKNTEILKGKLDRITNTDELPRKFFTKKGDIIISQMGTVGDVGVVRNEEVNWLFASFTIRIRLTEQSEFIPEFIGLYIQNIAKPYYLYRNIAQASVRQNTDLPTIKNMYIPKVDIIKQEEIANLINESLDLNNRSENLLDIAKKAVQIAIEQDESTALKFIQSTIN